MSEPVLLTDWQGEVCTLTLNRPGSGNALSVGLVERLHGAADKAQARGAQMLVITGAGRHFCTGFDLSDLQQQTDDSLLARFVRIELMLQRIAHAPFATVAVARGRVMGAGADLFAACGLRLVAGDASFTFPGWKGFGLVLGSGRLGALVGAHHARQWIETAAVVDLDTALQAGLVSACADSADALATAIAQCRAGGDTLRTALQCALYGEPQATAARDLDALVRSAARPGLQARVAAYVAAIAAARRQPAP